MKHSFAPTSPRRVELHFANLPKTGTLFGGAFRDAGRMKVTGAKLYRVNMAQEIRKPADIVVPTQDFGTPPEGIFKHALLKAAKHLIRGGVVYVGCGYGIGRTGTFIAAMCKLNREVLYLTRRAKQVGDDAILDPVQDARRVYLPNAVETEAQEEFVRNLNVTGLARRLAFRIKPTVVLDKRFYGG